MAVTSGDVVCFKLYKHEPKVRPWILTSTSTLTGLGPWRGAGTDFDLGNENSSSSMTS